EFGSIDALMSASAEKLGSVKGIGPVVAKHVYDFFHRAGGQKLVKELRELGVRLTEPQKQKPRDVAGTDLSGKTFVITGTLEKYSRDEIERLIKQRGGKATGSVSSKTGSVVAGDDAG